MIVQKGFTIWLTGLASDDVSELATQLEGMLLERGLKVELLDEQDYLIQVNIVGLDAYSAEDYNNNAEKLGFVARLLSRNEVIVIVNSMAPAASARVSQRELLRDFIEVYVEASPDALANIDKRLASAYEVPEKPEVLLDKPEETNKAKLKKVVRTLEILKWIPQGSGKNYSEKEEKQIRERLEKLGYL